MVVAGLADDVPSTMPANASHQVGVGACVLNVKGEKCLNCASLIFLHLGMAPVESIKYKPEFFNVIIVDSARQVLAVQESGVFQGD